MKHFKLILKNHLCILCASFLLVGCSYFDTSEHAELETAKPDMTVEEIAEPEPVDFAKVTAERTGGSVQIFGLDDFAPGAYEPMTAPTREPITSPSMDYNAREVEAPRAMAPASVSTPLVFSADPSVQVFPFEDNMVPVAPVAPLNTMQSTLPVRQPAREQEYVAIGAGSGNKTVVYFDHDSATLTADAREKIASVAGSFNNAAGRGLTVEGHASVRANYGSESQRRIVNLKVSMDRAFAVSSALIEQGIPAEAIKVMAWGDARPPAGTDGKNAESAARRVEISR